MGITPSRRATSPESTSLPTLSTQSNPSRVDLGSRKITANVIAPGAIETDFSGGLVRDNPEVNRMVASMTALGRAGLPDDIGGAVAMLLSPESGWLNGQRVEVSGGMNL
jgi:NAD(P)-dependent dehydrogenase (short-subunit alcohol dehydrogenase family)